MKHWKVLALLVAVILASSAIGFWFGAKYAEKVLTQKYNPDNWNERAMRSLTYRLKLTPEQVTRVQKHMDRAVAELQVVRRETIDRTVPIINRTLGEIGGELTPEQKVEFEKMKKMKDEQTLDLLRGTPKTK